MGGVGLEMKDDKQVAWFGGLRGKLSRGELVLAHILANPVFGQQLLGGMFACKCQDVYSSELC